MLPITVLSEVITIVLFVRDRDKIQRHNTKLCSDEKTTKIFILNPSE